MPVSEDQRVACGHNREENSRCANLLYSRGVTMRKEQLRVQTCHIVAGVCGLDSLDTDVCVVGRLVDAVPNGDGEEGRSIRAICSVPSREGAAEILHEVVEGRLIEQACSDSLRDLVDNGGGLREADFKGHVFVRIHITSNIELTVHGPEAYVMPWFVEIALRAAEFATSHTIPCLAHGIGTADGVTCQYDVAPCPTFLADTGCVDVAFDFLRKDVT